MTRPFQRLSAWALRRAARAASPMPATPPTPSGAYQRREAYRHHPGQPGVEPTRFGDWEYNGRCTDFI